jgi:hypothetical protein
LLNLFSFPQFGVEPQECILRRLFRRVRVKPNCHQITDHSFPRSLVKGRNFAPVPFTSHAADRVWLLRISLCYPLAPLRQSEAADVLHGNHIILGQMGKAAEDPVA